MAFEKKRISLITDPGFGIDIAGIAGVCCQEWCAATGNPSIPEDAKLKQFIVTYDNGVFQEYWTYPPSSIHLGYTPLVKQTLCDGSPVNDNVSPTAIFSPENDATGVGTAVIPTADFDERIQLKTGLIQVIRTSNGVQTVKVYDVATSQEIEITNGGQRLRLLNAGLQRGESYRIVIPDSAICDLAGNAFTGANANQWQFTVTIASVSDDPVLLSVNPAHNTNEVPANTNPQFTFSEPMVFTGIDSLYILEHPSLQLVKEYPDVSEITFGGQENTLLTLANAGLEANKAYTYLIPPGAVAASNGRGFPGLTQNQVIFYTEDTLAPTIESQSPAPGAQNITVIDPVLTLNEASELTGPGTIRIIDKSDSSVLKTYATGSAEVVRSNANKTFTLLNHRMDVGGDYDIVIDNNAIADLAGNFFTGIAADEWNFDFNNPGLLATPTGVFVSAQTHFQTQLNWTGVSGANLYELRVKQDGYAYWTYFTTSNPYFLLQGLKESTQYLFEIRAKSNTNESNWTQTFSFLTAANLGSQATYGPGAIQVPATETTHAIANAALATASNAVEILYERGGLYAGQFDAVPVPNTNAANRNRIGVYGVGEMPKFVGTQEAVGWVQDPGEPTLFYAPVPNDIIVGWAMIDGNRQYPCASPLFTIEHDPGLENEEYPTSLKSSSLVGLPTDLSQTSQVTLRGTRFTSETQAIESYNSATGEITWSKNISNNANPAKHGYGFRIYNSREYCLNEGDYYIDLTQGRIYVKTDGTAPIATIEVPVEAYTIDFTGGNYEFNDVEVYGAASDGALIRNQSNIRFQSCKINYCYNAGIFNDRSPNNLELIDTEVAYISGVGVYGLNGSNSTISHCHIHHIADLTWGRQVGIFEADESANNQFAAGVTFKASSNNKVIYTYVHHTGGNGIRVDGKDQYVGKNKVHDTNLWNSDGACIYNWSNNADPNHSTATTRIIIEDNVVSRCIGNLEGYFNPAAQRISNGIYLDLRVSHATVRRNVSFSNTDAGLHVNQRNRFNIIEDNLFYDNQTGMLFANFEDIDKQSHSNIIRRNTVVSLKKFTLVYELVNARDDSVHGPWLPGTFSDNVYLAPYAQNGQIINRRDNHPNIPDNEDNLKFTYVQWLAHSGETGSAFPEENWAFVSEGQAKIDIPLYPNYESMNVEQALPPGSWEDGSGLLAGSLNVPAHGARLIWNASL